jgi:tetratricopeptide (TPR) repeat protein
MWSVLRQKASVVPSALDLAYRTTIKIVVVVFAVVLVGVTFNAILNDHIVIEPLSVPHKLEDDGYSGAIVSQRLRRQVVDIVGSAETLLSEPTSEGGAAERVTFSNEEALENLSAIQVPSSGLSLRSVSGVLRNFFGHPERKITGEITIKRPAGPIWPAVYSIALRLPADPNLHAETSLRVEHTDIDEAINLAAQSIAQQYDPLSLAAFYYREDKKTTWEREKAQGYGDNRDQEKWKKGRREKWDKVDRIAGSLIESAKFRKEGLFLRGIYLREIENFDDAIYVFRQATKDYDKFSDAYNGLGSVLVKAGRIEEALKTYDDAIKVSPDDSRARAEAFRNRALAYKSSGDYQRAIKDFQEAAGKLKDVDVFLELGIVYERVGQWDNAVKAYDQAIMLQPRHPWALNNRCYDKAILGKRTAIVDCNAALRLKQYPAFYDARGFAYLQLKEFTKAIDDYTTALGLYPGGLTHPDQAYSLFGRGVAKLRTGDLAGGNADIVAAHELRSGIEEEMEKMGVTP